MFARNVCRELIISIQNFNKKNVRGEPARFEAPSIDSANEGGATRSGTDLELKLDGESFFSKGRKNNTQLRNNESKLLIKIRTLLIYYEIVNF
jgi:hypothetical protein